MPAGPRTLKTEGVPRHRVPILADADILAALKSGGLAIEPFEERHLTPNGLDLVAAEVVLPDAPDAAGAAPVREGKVLVPPLARFAVSTREVVTCGPSVCGSLWIRSSYARKGILASFGKVEAGFSGTLTLAAFNSSAKPFELALGERFCQIVFERMESEPAKLYAARSGNYQNQRGVNLGR